MSATTLTLILAGYALAQVIAAVAVGKWIRAQRREPSHISPAEFRADADAFLATWDARR